MASNHDERMGRDDRGNGLACVAAQADSNASIGVVRPEPLLEVLGLDRRQAAGFLQRRAEVDGPEVDDGDAARLRVRQTSGHPDGAQCLVGRCEEDVDVAGLEGVGSGAGEAALVPQVRGAFE